MEILSNAHTHNNTTHKTQQEEEEMKSKSPSLSPFRVKRSCRMVVFFLGNCLERERSSGLFGQIIDNQLREREKQPSPFHTTEC